MKRALFLCLVLATALAAAPPLTSIQDRLYKANGTAFTGIVTIEWRSFDASDASNIPTNALEVRVINGILKINLVPTTNATPRAAQYRVKYVSDGRIQFNELWAVPPSSTPLRVKDVRVTAPVTGGTGGSVGGITAVAISDVTGLQTELDLRPAAGFNYTPNRVVISNDIGQLESALGSDMECVHVDGTSGPCGGGATGVFEAGFQDTEIPSGTIDGVNQTFALVDAPSPVSSLQFFRNGIMQRQSLDYNLTGTNVTFVSNAIPQPGDILQASYRTRAVSGPSHVLCAGTGSATASATAVSLATCSIPANLLHTGDRVEIILDLRHTGTATTSLLEVKWGATTLLTRSAGTTADLMTARLSFGFAAAAGQYSSQSWGNNLTLANSAGSWTGVPEDAVTVDFRGSLGSSGPDTLSVVNYTVLRYPAP